MSDLRNAQTWPRTLGTRLAAILSGALLLALSSPPCAQAWFKADLVRCADTVLASTTGVSCGGDTLTEGHVLIIPSGIIVTTVVEALADPFNLYEVCWLPVGEAVANAVLVGNFATDCDGNARAVLREIVTPADIVGGTIMNMYTEVGAPDAGVFLVFSRGPWGFADVDGNCRPDTLNTVPLGTDPTLSLANPAVDLATDGVQFFSGYTN